VTSESAFIGIDEVDEGPDVLAVGDAGLLFTPLEPFLAGGVIGGGVMEHGVAVGGFVGVGLTDVTSDPIAHLAVGDGEADEIGDLVMGDAGVLEPEAIEAFAEVVLVIGVEETGEVESEFIDVPGQVHPTVHGFAGASGVDDGAHGGGVSGGGREGVNGGGRARILA